MKNRQGIIWAPILIIIATVVVAGIAGFFLYKVGNTNKTENNNANLAVVNQANDNANTNITTNTSQVANNNASTNTNIPSNTNTSTNSQAGWKTYTNSTYHFSFKYPPTYSVNVSTTQYGTYTPQDITIDALNDFNLEVGPAASTDSSILKVFEKTYNFSDLSTTVSTENPVNVGSFSATHYCGIPGNYSYCYIMLVHNKTFFGFTRPDNVELSQNAKDILSTFTFTN